MATGIGGEDGEGFDNITIDDNEYYSDEKLKNIISDNPENALTIMSLNINSIPRRINDLSIALHFWDFKPDIIGITETAITEKVNSYYMPFLEGYRYIPSPLSTKVKGSAGIFIKDFFDITLRKDLDISVPGIFETVWFDISSLNWGLYSLFLRPLAAGVIVIAAFGRRGNLVRVIWSG